MPDRSVRIDLQLQVFLLVNDLKPKQLSGHPTREDGDEEGLCDHRGRFQTHKCWNITET